MSDGPPIVATVEPDREPSSRPGTGGDLRGRLLRHYLPLLVATGLAMVGLMNLAFFDANRYPPPLEIMTEGISGAFPGEATPMGPGTHGPGESGATPTDDSGGEGGAPPMDHGGGEGGAPPMDHGGDPNNGGQSGPATGQNDEQAESTSETSGPGDTELLMRRYSTATGYVALGLLGLTLLIGPANLLLRKRTPLSSYLCRDVGIWAAAVSVLHVVFGLLTKHADGILSYFVEPDDRSRILTTSFGLANWTGLAAVVIVAALAAISSDAALRRLKYRRWKRIQRLNYVLFPLAIMHALLYGALRRMTSPYTAMLIVCSIAVVVGQAVGVRLWRQRKARRAPIGEA